MAVLRHLQEPQKVAHLWRRTDIETYGYRLNLPKGCRYDQVLKILKEDGLL